MLLRQEAGRRGQARRGDRRVPAGPGNSPELKVQALLHAGLSFKANGVSKLAERNFEDAVRIGRPEGDTATLNELHYNLGLLAEEQGNKAIAEEHLQRGRRQRLLLPRRRAEAPEARREAAGRRLIEETAGWIRSNSSPLAGKSGARASTRLHPGRSSDPPRTKTWRILAW